MFIFYTPQAGVKPTTFETMSNGATPINDVNFSIIYQLSDLEYKKTRS